MQEVQPALIARDHTILGICEGLGEDLGFNPLYLRIVFGVSLLISPFWVVTAYLVAGVAVMISRLLVPDLAARAARRQAAAKRAAQAQAATERTRVTDNDNINSDNLAVAA